uniref:G_PROTEIN_RECEP_F1_2 domain-containing protein n=1 Tax=Elaeophora elaphi TaxID=1147741 RepID=A0A0R3RP27_9BILA
MWINRTFSTFYPFSVFSVLHFSFLLTLNRLIVLTLPQYCTLFNPARLYFLIVFVWFSISVMTIADFYYCIRKFLAWNITWEINCTKLGAASNTWRRMRYFWALAIPNIMFIMYIVIFCHIRHRRRGITNAENKANAMDISRYEWSMLVQAAWNCGILESSLIISAFLQPILIEISGKEIIIPSQIFINCY